MDGAVLALLLLTLGSVAPPERVERADAAAPEVCTTRHGAPAATSPPLVRGLWEQMQAGDREGAQKYLDTGQTLFLNGGKTVEVLQRPGDGLVLVRRGPGRLPLWTLQHGIDCSGAGERRPADPAPREG